MSAHPPGDRPVLRFWPHLAQARIASTRIRCLQVIDGLRAEEVDAGLFDASAAAPRVLVLAKRYDEATLAQALALREAQGTRLVLDLCDNHFHHEAGHEAWARRAEGLRRACAQVDLVVAASAALADVITAEVPGALVQVVPDSLDRQAGQATASPTLAERLHALRWALFARRHAVAPGRRLLWFGNHGSRNAEGGMAELNRIASSLARHQAQAPITLCVVSNRWKTWRQVSRGWAWPSLYLPWSDANFGLALRHHAVALIPAQRNPFTLCKTNNRLATAFLNGLAVAADGLPSYEEFRDLAVLDDWDAGLADLMARNDARSQRIAAARQRLEERYSLPIISRRWLQVLAEAGIALD